MTESDFEKQYPKDKFKYVRKSKHERGSLGQTEIEVYDILNIETQEVVLTATRTEHTNLRGLDTIIKWDW